MDRGATSGGLKKRRNFAVLANTVSTTPIISVALAGDYCLLNRERNGRLAFVNCSTV